MPRSSQINARAIFLRIVHDVRQQVVDDLFQGLIRQILQGAAENPAGNTIVTVPRALLGRWSARWNLDADWCREFARAAVMECCRTVAAENPVLREALFYQRAREAWIKASEDMVWDDIDRRVISQSLPMNNFSYRVEMKKPDRGWHCEDVILPLFPYFGTETKLRKEAKIGIKAIIAAHVEKGLKKPKRVDSDIEDRLDDFIKGFRKKEKRGELVPSGRKNVRVGFQDEHFIWAVAYQVPDDSSACSSYGDIAKKRESTKSTVKEAINNILHLIDLPQRLPIPAGRKIKEQREKMVRKTI